MNYDEKLSGPRAGEFGARDTEIVLTITRPGGKRLREIRNEFPSGLEDTTTRKRAVLTPMP